MALNGWKEKLYQRYLKWVCRPGRIEKHLGTVLPSSARPASGIKTGLIRTAALQVELKLFKNPLHYADEMHRRTREAVKEGARLIAFPEYNNLPLLGLLPGFEKMEETYRKKANEPKSKEGNKKEKISLADVFCYMNPAVQPLVIALFSRLAAAYNIYIMTGSFALAANGRVINRSYLFGPSGLLIGSQDKVNLTLMETEWNMKRGSAFSVYETSLGRLALPVCMDATYYETFRILEKKGADIVLLPIANLEEYNYWLALRGIWPRVQESQLYGIKSTLVGNIAGLNFTGRAGIFAPLEITPRQNGVLAEVETCNNESMAVADLDLEALHSLRRSHPWRDNNQALYDRYFPKIYG